MIINIPNWLYMGIFYSILIMIIGLIIYNYYQFRNEIKQRNRRLQNIGIYITLLLCCLLLHKNRVDLGFIDGYSQNMYLEGAVLRYNGADMCYQEIQPNNIRHNINYIEKNLKQNKVLEQDDSNNVFLRNCVKEVNILNLLKIRSTYNILYLDEETYDEYLLDSKGVTVDKNTGKMVSEDRKKHTLSIELDKWMDDVDLLGDEGQLN